MGGKAKPTKHTTAEINRKVADATTNKGGGAAGLADRKGGNAGHSKYKCHICAQSAPDLKVCQRRRRPQACPSQPLTPLPSTAEHANPPRGQAPQAAVGAREVRPRPLLVALCRQSADTPFLSCRRPAGARTCTRCLGPRRWGLGSAGPPRSERASGKTRSVAITHELLHTAARPPAVCVQEPLARCTGCEPTTLLRAGCPCC